MLIHIAYWELASLCIVTPKTARKHYQEMQPALWRKIDWVPHIDWSWNTLDKDTSDPCRALWKYKRSALHSIEWCVKSCFSFLRFFVYLSVLTDFYVLFSPLPVFSISSVSLPASSLTLTVFLCCYLSTAHQASPAGYAAEPLPHRTKQPGLHWYAAEQGLVGLFVQHFVN